MGRRFRWGARRGLPRQAILASLPAGGATLSSATWKAQRTTSSSRATISLQTKMYAASFLNYLILLWEQKRFAFGRERLRRVTAAAGYKWSVERGLPRLSCWSKKEMPISEVNRRTVGVSLLVSRTLWSTRVDTRLLRRSALRGRCSRMSCPMTLRARRHFPTTAGHSPMMRSIGSCAFSQTEGSREIAWDPTAICYESFLMWDLLIEAVRRNETNDRRQPA